MTIPDDGISELRSSVTVSGSSNAQGVADTLSGIEVKLTIAHTNVSDLEAYLIAPNGQVVQLFTNVGGSGDNYTDTVFKSYSQSAAELRLNDGTEPFQAPFNNSAGYRAEEDLGQLLGMDPRGEWTLVVLDSVEDVAGTLLDWSVNLIEKTGNVETANTYLAKQASVSQPATWNEYHVVLGRDGVALLEFGNYQLATIHGFKFADIDGNRIRESNEQGLGGITLFVDMNDNGVRDRGEPHATPLFDDAETTFNEAGYFTIGSVKPGTYKVREELSTRYRQTVPVDDGIGSVTAIEVKLQSGATIGHSVRDISKPAETPLAPGLVFANQPLGEIRGRKWVDQNGNGQLDPGEPGLPGVTIYADLNHNGQFDAGDLSAVTMADDPATLQIDEAGRYQLPNLPSAGYEIREVVPAGSVQTSGGSIVIYQNDFESGFTGKEWTLDRVNVTPAGGRHFLGLLGNETVTLQLDNLLPHQRVSISADLYIVGSWDGNHALQGPDRWQMRYDEQLLVNTTFSNIGGGGKRPPTWQNPNERTDIGGDGITAPLDALLLINDLNKLGVRLLEIPDPNSHFLDANNDGFITPQDVLVVVNRLNEARANPTVVIGPPQPCCRLSSQSYPDNWMVAEHAAQTGAVESNTLGYGAYNLILNDARQIQMNSVYAIHKTFLHTANLLTLDFEALGLVNHERVAFEKWGLDNVIVTLLGDSYQVDLQADQIVEGINFGNMRTKAESEGAPVPPMNNVPGLQSTNENAPLSFSVLHENQISISDPDADDSIMSVKLAGENGVIAVDGDATGLTSLSGNNTDMVTLAGTLDALNTALSTLTFTPSFNFNGTAALEIVTKDAGTAGSPALTDSDTVGILVNPVNGAPVASDDVVTVRPATTSLINVLSNDTDPDNDVLAITSFTQPLRGVVTKNADETFTYDPPTSLACSDEFTYTIADPAGLTDSASVLITLREAAVPENCLTFAGQKFNDKNSNGMRDTGEFGLDGWEIQFQRLGASPLVVTTASVDLDNDGTINPETERGRYTIQARIASGQYELREVPQPGWVPTDPSNGIYSLTLDPRTTAVERHFGNRQLDVSVERILLPDGDDTIFGFGSNDQLYGDNFILDPWVFSVGTLSDHITGGNGDDQIFGQEQDDVLSGEVGHDLLNGGGGVDRVEQTVDQHQTLTDTLVTGQGNDLLLSIERATLTGGPNGNDINASAFTLGPVVLIGLQGNDTLTGTIFDDRYVFFDDADAAEKDILEDGGGKDWLDFSAISSGVTVDLNLPNMLANHGTRTITTSDPSQFENVLGGTAADDITGNAANNLIHAGAGNDTVHGGAGDDVIFGEAGMDSLFGEGDNDALDGGVGNDVMLDGGAGNDTLKGGAGDDVLNGGMGNDIFVFPTDSAQGSDNILEAGGSDTLDFSQTIDHQVTIDLAIMTAQVVNSNLTVTLSGVSAIENVIGGARNDTLTGNSLNNTLTGGAGNDNYVFNADVAQGNDTIDESGGGVDTLDFSPSLQAVTISLATATAQTVNGNLMVTLSSAITLENVIGGAGNDIITGNTRNNTLTGGIGDDVLEGGPGDDVYWFAEVTTNNIEQDTVIELAGGGRDHLDFGALSNVQYVELDLAQTNTITFGRQFQIGGLPTLKRTLKLPSTQLGQNPGIEIVSTGAGDDTIVANGAQNVLAGGDGDDRYQLPTGLTGDVTLVEGATVFAGGIITAGGLDTVDFSAFTTAVVFDLNLAVNATGGLVLRLKDLQSDDAPLHYENLTGGAGNDTLIGNRLANVIQGGDGSNHLRGGAGDDTYVFVNAVNSMKTYLFETGGSFGGGLVTSGGSDILDFSALTTSVVFDLRSVTNVLANNIVFLLEEGGPATCTAIDPAANCINAPHLFENILGALNATNNLIGNQSDNILTGGNLADMLFGQEGADILIGLDGVDKLHGEEDRDLLLGGMGIDNLAGGTGDDILIGGYTTYETMPAHRDLETIRRAWVTPGSAYATRIDRIMNGLGLGMGNPSLRPRLQRTVPNQTVFDDNAADDLVGDGDLDWFLSNLGDNLGPLELGEQF